MNLSDKRLLIYCHQIDRLDRIIEGKLDRGERITRALDIRRRVRVDMSYVAQSIGNRLRWERENAA